MHIYSHGKPLVVLRLDISQISFNGLETWGICDKTVWTIKLLKAFAVYPPCNEHCFLRHLAWGVRRNENFEIVFGQESNLRLKAFRFLKFSFRLSFFSFSFLFAAVIGLLLGLLAVKKLLRKRHRDGKFWPWSSSEFLTQLFEHFCAYLRLHQADDSDLGIIGKIFSSCRSWL